MYMQFMLTLHRITITGFILPLSLVFLSTHQKGKQVKRTFFAKLVLRFLQIAVSLPGLEALDEEGAGFL